MKQKITGNSILATILLCTPSLAATYQPLLPKTTPTTSVSVYQTEFDKGEQGIAMWGNHDIYGLGRRNSSEVLSGDFYIGPDDPTDAIKLKSGFVLQTDAFPKVYSIDVLPYISNQYGTAFANAGSHVFFRVNPNSKPPKGNGLFGVTFNTGESVACRPVLTLTVRNAQSALVTIEAIGDTSDKSLHWAAWEVYPKDGGGTAGSYGGEGNDRFARSGYRNADGNPAFCAVFPVRLPSIPAGSSIVGATFRLRAMGPTTWHNNEAMLAIRTIQGLVNRTSARKIYLLDSPNDKKYLEDGLVSVPHEFPSIDFSDGELPLLRHLLKSYASYIKGKVRYASLATGGGTFTGESSPLMAALTACGIDDAIPVTDYLDSVIASQGYSFPQKADTRALIGSIAAFRWARDNYFTDATNRSIIGKWGYEYNEGSDPNFSPPILDYYIAHRVFIYSLDCTISGERTELASLLNSNYYPPGTPIIGRFNGEYMELIEPENLGYWCNWYFRANHSVHGSFAYDPARIVAPKPPTAVTTIDVKGAYVAFHVTDGDNFDHAVGYKAHWENYACDIPIGWTMQPMIIDLFPKLFNWYADPANGHDGKYELIATLVNGVGPRKGSAAKTSFVNLARHYLRNSGEMFMTYNNFYFSTKDSDDAATAAINPYFCIQGYQGTWNGNDVSWYTLNNDSVVTVNLSGATGGITGQEVANAAKFVVDKTPAGTPAFVVVSAGDRRNGKTPVLTVQAAAALLKAETGRTYHFLRPRDLAATWSAWRKGGQTPISVRVSSAAPSSPAQQATVMLFDCRGKLVGRYVTDGSAKSISIKNHSTGSRGMYIVNVRGSTGEYAKKLLLKGEAP